MPRFLFILLPITASFLAGCDQQVSESPPDQLASLALATAADDMGTPDDYCGEPSASEPSTTAATASGDFMVELIDLPAELPTNEIFSFKLRVSPASGVAARARSVLVNGGMPQHAHGMNVKPHARQDPNSESGDIFLVEGMMFHMPGAWELYIDVVDGPYTERVTFDVLAR